MSESDKPVVHQQPAKPKRAPNDALEALRAEFQQFRDASCQLACANALRHGRIEQALQGIEARIAALEAKNGE